MTAREAPDSPASRARARGAPGLWVSLLLLAAVLAVNGAAIWGILAARDSTRRLAREELARETTVHARSLEALLAKLRADVAFLAGSPALGRFAGAAPVEPMARRWARLDVEGSVLLFLEANPAVERLAVAGAGGETVLAGRRAGAPTVLPAEAPLPARSPSDDGVGWLHGTWPLGPGAESGVLEAWAAPAALMALAAPGLGGRLRLVADREPETPAGPVSATVPVADPGWEPPLAAFLVRREEAPLLVTSVERLARRYRTTVVLNGAVVVLSLLLGTVGFQQIRRAARLEAEAAHQARLRELERQLLHSERLASVGRLAAGIAHEINNPLAGMTNYLRLLEDDLARGDAAAARELVPRVREGLERAATITRQVLTFSDPGKAPAADLELGAVLADAARFVRGNPELAKVEIALSLPETPVLVHGNATTLGQLFLNLVLNACQAQPGGGRVEIELERDGERARVRVADHGPGLSEDVLRHLFEPFYSGRGSTGLGLAVCHGIAADHGGTLEGRNRDGGGAVFELTLPLAGTVLASGASAR